MINKPTYENLFKNARLNKNIIPNNMPRNHKTNIIHNPLY